MDKLLVLLLIAISIYNAFGQQVQNNNNRPPPPRLPPPFTTTRVITNPAAPTRATPTPVTTTTTAAAGSSVTPQSAQFRQCITNCPTTPEYNPVCGTDNVTYTNLGRLLCARSCGLNVTVLRAESRCSISSN